jgi:hypothetical protein
MTNAKPGENLAASEFQNSSSRSVSELGRQVLNYLHEWFFGLYERWCDYLSARRY